MRSSFVNFTCVATLMWPALVLAESTVIDGVLDEPVWSTAALIDGFVVTAPYSLEIPPRETDVRYFSDDGGIYIGFTNYQSASESSASTTLRDEDIRADFNEVVIDFDASGDRGFGFKVSRQDSVQDSVWTNQNRESVDWDGEWQHAVFESADFWSSEIFVPWNITVAGSLDANRTIGIYFARWHEGQKQRYAFPRISPSQQVFLNSFQKLNFENSERASLDFFPYLRSDQDLVAKRANYKAGIDIFWKPASNRQVNIAINPDFGQVESNELVVNFSAIETFFSEKRPFFRENHELFDIHGPETLRLIHTPNIGGEPDGGNSNASDILGAARFTQIGDRIDFGVLTAMEDDSNANQGRNYFASRVQYKHENGKFGLLQSRVDRPELGREANTLAVDVEHFLSEQIRVTGQYIYSDIQQRSARDSADTGWWLTSEWQPEDSVSHNLTLFDYGSNFDVSDFGFVRRVDRQQAEYEFEKEWSDLPLASIRDATLGVGLEYGSNSRNDSLPKQIEAALELVTQSTSAWEIDVEYRSKGIDDLITRGGNPAQFPSNIAAGLSYESERTGRFSWGASVDTGTDGLQERFIEFGFEPQLQITDQVNLAMEIEYVRSDSWVIFLEDNKLGDFSRDELSTTLELSAQFKSKHQLSIKLESVLLEAKAKQSLTALPTGSLVPNSNQLGGFSLSEFAFQARYRYELGPLSEIFLVYSKGGEFEEDILGRNFDYLFKKGFHDPQESRILFKIKRQF